MYSYQPMQSSYNPETFNIYEFNAELKTHLESYYKRIYIEHITKAQENNKTVVINSKDMFKVVKKLEPIFEKINSKKAIADINEDLTEINKDFIHDMGYLIDAVSISENDKNSLETLLNLVKNRQGQLKTYSSRFLKTLDENPTWNIDNIKEQYFYKVLQKILKDIIENVIRVVDNGRKYHTVYDEVLKIFNRFISSLGIYTCDHIKIGTSLNSDELWSLVAPQDCNDCETNDQSKKDTIKDISSLAYIFSDKYIVVPAHVTVWKN